MSTWFMDVPFWMYVRAILGKKAAQLPTRAGGAKNTKLTWFGGFSRSSNSQYQAYSSRLELNYRMGPFENWILLISSRVQRGCLIQAQDHYIWDNSKNLL